MKHRRVSIPVPRLIITLGPNRHDASNAMTGAEGHSNSHSRRASSLKLKLARVSSGRSAYALDNQAAVRPDEPPPPTLSLNRERIAIDRIIKG
jgi:hypothetical protein